jgi:hypothetical protein
MRSVSAGRLVKAMAFGILGSIVALVFDAAIAYLRKDWTNPVGIVLVGGVAAISGVVPLLQGDGNGAAPTAAPLQPSGPPPSGPTAYGTASYGPPPGAPPGYPAPPYPQPGSVPPYGATPPIVQPRAKRRGLPVLLGVLILLVVCGGGVAGVTYAAQYVGSLVTGEESGTNVLVEPQSATVGALTLTVKAVTLTAHYTRVDMTAANGGSSELTLPVFDNCQLNSPDGPTLSGDEFRSHWTQSIPAGQSVTGTVVFSRLADGTATIAISFSVIYGMFAEGGGGPASITVSNIPLSAPRS